MAIIKSSGDLTRWLQDKPPQFATAIGSRIALRVLPLAQPKQKDGRALRRFLLNLFRTNAVLRLNVAGLENSLDAVASAQHALDRAAEDVASRNQAAFRAGEVVYRAAEASLLNQAAPDKGGEAVDAALITIKTAAEDAQLPFDEIDTIEKFYQAISDDCSWMDQRAHQGISLVDFLKRRLWPDSIPHFISAKYKTFLKHRSTSAAFSPWNRWYSLKLSGDNGEWGLNEKKEQEIAIRLIEATDRFWDATIRDPVDINQEITSWLNDVNWDTDLNTEINSIDFFVSYTADDESAAREVVKILNDAGYSTFSQFKDMPTGSNFVKEMDRGLSIAKGFIALYSNAYFVSKHCRAELAFGYAQDPDGENRFVRALYLEPCELPPLARQIVYQSLIGIGPAERKKKILQVAGYRRTQQPKTEIAKFAQDIVSPKPQLMKDGKIGMKPNPVYDRQPSPHDILDPIRQMLGLLKALLPTLGRNTPAIISSNLNVYQQELNAHRSQASWGMLERLVRNAETAFRATDIREFDAGILNQFEDILRLHSECRMALPRADERFNRLADAEVDETVSGAAIADPTTAIENAAETLRSDDLTAPSFDRGVADIVRMGRDQEYPTPADEVVSISPEDDGALERVAVEAISARKAWIVGALGIAKETYNLLGSSASLASLQSVREAMTYLADAISKLMNLLR